MGTCFDVHLDFLAWETDVGGIGLKTFAFSGVAFDEAGAVEYFVEAADAQADAEVPGEEEPSASRAVAGVSAEADHGFYHFLGRRFGVRFRAAGTVCQR